MSQSLQPITFEDFIGQDKIKENLKVYIQAALQKQVMMDHILLSGSSGLGKTTLSQIIAHHFNAPLKIINAPTIEAPFQLAQIFSTIQSNEFILIDEIHALSSKCEEFLYPILQDYRMDFMVQYASQSKAINLTLPPFTLIGATTKPYALSTPLQNRFPIQFVLEPYTFDSIKEIIIRNANLLNVTLSQQAIETLAYVTRFTPRLINAHLKRLADYQIVYQKSMIDEKLLNKYLNNQNINHLGLNQHDLNYLNYLKNEQAAKGLASIASSLNLDASYINEQIEPYLLRLKLIELTKTGRQLTKKGKSIVI